jgi:Rrf2 family protein
VEFSRTTSYALRTLALMAEEEKELFSADYLHKQLKIPKKYLQRLLTDLAKYGLVKSSRGKYGGFSLARKKEKITVAQIVDAVEGLKKKPSCFFGFDKCKLKDPCAMHDVWSSTQKDILDTLSTTKLADIIRIKA